MGRAIPSGGSEALMRLGAGEYVGEIGLAIGVPHPATAVALSQCEIIQLPEATVRPLVLSNADMAAELERTARRALEILQSSAASGDSDQRAHPERLLDRLRAFFTSVEGQQRRGD